MLRPIAIPTAEERPEVEIFVEGESVRAREGESVAAALLKAGRVPFRRTPVSGGPRAPLCLMGVCFECLLEIDGVQNVQSCMVPVRAGMNVNLQDGARRIAEEQ
jgi:predicted molibdopterin-dependent oxidoreductase YjgC